MPETDFFILYLVFCRSFGILFTLPLFSSIDVDCLYNDKQNHIDYPSINQRHRSFQIFHKCKHEYGYDSNSPARIRFFQLRFAAVVPSYLQRFDPNRRIARSMVARKHTKLINAQLPSSFAFINGTSSSSITCTGPYK